jgi:hypothetical protein
VSLEEDADLVHCVAKRSLFLADLLRVNTSISGVVFFLAAHTCRALRLSLFGAGATCRWLLASMGWVVSAYSRSCGRCWTCATSILVRYVISFSPAM